MTIDLWDGDCFLDDFLYKETGHKLQTNYELIHLESTCTSTIVTSSSTGLAISTMDAECKH